MALSVLSAADAVKDTERQVQGQQAGQRELQLVVEQRAVWEDALLDAGLHGTLRTQRRSARTRRRGVRHQRRPYREEVHGHLVLVLFSLQLIDELHHGPTERERTVSRRVLAGGRREAERHLGFRNSSTTLYS
ncbi:hypothetical protein EYF80_067217 [Liparis tanakae]|uniref:Uncharacterized protein n=1 Tax=Liparis tanakae TaxID=230148 RepID=A0A4Z2E1S4_9TELE|nr:hypothetical protein EYF80_067217 [Liparis tanakae]